MNIYVERAKQLKTDHIRIYDFSSGIDKHKGQYEQVRMRQHNGRKAFVLTHWQDKEGDDFLENVLQEGMFYNEKQPNPFDVVSASKDHAEAFLSGMTPVLNEIYWQSPIKKQSPSKVMKDTKTVRGMLNRMVKKTKEIRNSRAN